MLQAANELPIGRVVVDASMWSYQNQLAKSLQRDGAEVVLDTKAAELASPSRSKGSNAKAPRANINNGAPLGPNLYRKKHASDLIGAIARFSVEADVDTGFATNSWEKPYAKKEGGSFRRAKRISVPGLDKSLTIPEINLLASARHGRRLIGCEDRDCCAQGLTEMLKHPLKHTIKQTNIELSNLQAIPDAHRATHFVDKILAKSARLTTRIASLQPNENKAAEFGVDTAKLMKSLKNTAKHSTGVSMYWNSYLNRQTLRYNGQPQ